jgi:hypothetical protein
MAHAGERRPDPLDPNFNPFDFQNPSAPPLDPFSPGGAFPVDNTPNIFEPPPPLAPPLTHPTAFRGQIPEMPLFDEIEDALSIQRGSQFGEQLFDMAGFDELRQKLADDLGFGRNQGEASFDRQRKAASAGFGSRIAAINREIGEKKEELAEKNKSYRIFMETISPGFVDAVEKAEKAALATAAIEQVFTKSEEAVEAVYSSASGRVRAIADKVAGVGSVEVAQALNETVFEMKDFIDRQQELNRDQTLTLHRTAAGLAAATAESEHANIRGTTGREQFVVQKQYEKLINNLIKQRAAAGAARGRAMSNIAAAREEWRKGFDRDAAARFEEVDEMQVKFLSANSDWDSFAGGGLSVFLHELSDNPELAIPRTEHATFRGTVALMDQLGTTHFDQFVRQVTQVDPLTGESLMSVDQVESLMQWEDQLELGVRHLTDMRNFYNSEFVGEPTSNFGQFANSMELARDLNLNFSQAEHFAINENRNMFDPFTMQQSPDSLQASLEALVRR